MSSSSFTDRDFEIFAAAMRSAKDGGEIQVDNEKLAVEGRFKNANSARVAWHGLKKKIQAAAASPSGGTEEGDQGTDAGEGGETPKTPASGKKRKAAVKADADDENDESPAKKATPKKGRKPRDTKVTAKEDTVNDADGEEAATTPAKATPAKKGRKPTVKVADAPVVKIEKDSSAEPEKADDKDEATEPEKKAEAETGEKEGEAEPEKGVSADEEGKGVSEETAATKQDGEGNKT